LGKGPSQKAASKAPSHSPSVAELKDSGSEISQTSKKSNPVEKLKPVKGNFLITPLKFAVNSNGQLTVSGRISVRLTAKNGKHYCHVIKVSNEPLDLGQEESAAIIESIRKCQR
jgi:hypothetical protein